MKKIPIIHTIDEVDRFFKAQEYFLSRDDFHKILETIPHGSKVYYYFLSKYEYHKRNHKILPIDTKNIDLKKKESKVNKEKKLELSIKKKDQGVHQRQIQEISCKAVDFVVKNGQILYKNKYRLKSVRITSASSDILKLIHNTYLIEINNSNITFHFIPYTDLSTFINDINDARKKYIIMNIDIDDYLRAFKSKRIFLINHQKCRITDYSYSFSSSDVDLHAADKRIEMILCEILKKNNIKHTYHNECINYLKPILYDKFKDKICQKEEYSFKSDLTKGSLDIWLGTKINIALHFDFSYNLVPDYDEVINDKNMGVSLFFHYNPYRHLFEERLKKGDIYTFPEEVTKYTKEYLNLHEDDCILKTIFYAMSSTYLDFFKLDERFIEHHSIIKNYIDDYGHYPLKSEIFYMLENQRHYSDDQLWGTPSSALSDAYITISGKYITYIPMNESNASYHYTLMDESCKYRALYLIKNYFSNNAINNKRERNLVEKYYLAFGILRMSKGGSGRKNISYL